MGSSRVRRPPRRRSSGRLAGVQAVTLGGRPGPGSRWVVVRRPRHMAGGGRHGRALAQDAPSLVPSSAPSARWSAWPWSAWSSSCSSPSASWPAVPRPVLALASHVADAGYLLLFALIAPLVSVMDTGFGGGDPAVRPVPGPGPPAAGAPGGGRGRHPGRHGRHELAGLRVVNHQVPAPLRRVHALHHSQEDMSVFTTFRTHPPAHGRLPGRPAAGVGAGGERAHPGDGSGLLQVRRRRCSTPTSGGPSTRSAGILVSPCLPPSAVPRPLSPVQGRSAVNSPGFVLVCWDRLARCAAFPTGGAPVRHRDRWPARPDRAVDVPDASGVARGGRRRSWCSCSP